MKLSTERTHSMRKHMGCHGPDWGLKFNWSASSLRHCHPNCGVDVGALIYCYVVVSHRLTRLIHSVTAMFFRISVTSSRSLWSVLLQIASADDTCNPVAWCDGIPSINALEMGVYFSLKSDARMRLITVYQDVYRSGQICLFYFIYYVWRRVMLRNKVQCRVNCEEALRLH